MRTKHSLERRQLLLNVAQHVDDLETPRGEFEPDVLVGEEGERLRGGGYAASHRSPRRSRNPRSIE